MCTSAGCLLWSSSLIAESLDCWVEARVVATRLSPKQENLRRHRKIRFFITSVGENSDQKCSQLKDQSIAHWFDDDWVSIERRDMFFTPDGLAEGDIIQLSCRVSHEADTELQVKDWSLEKIRPSVKD